MILNRGGGKKYGIPYQGSKAKIMDTLAKMFPPAENFYDLFGGGFSVTHYMAENRAKSYKQFHYNEIRPGLPQLVQDAISGKYNFNVFTPEWISREKFMNDKESNPYIKIIWSFGNNGKDYIFGKDIEQQKKSMHMAVVFNEIDDWFLKTFQFKEWPKGLDITGKRLYLKRVIAKLKLERNDLEQLERLQQLQRLQQRILFTNDSYRNIYIKPNSVIYCDIPYQGTADYGNSFNNKEFFDWAAEQTEPLFISEYNVRDQRFYLLKEIAHRSTFASSGYKNIPVTEKLYGNKIAYDIISKYRSLKNG